MSSVHCPCYSVHRIDGGTHNYTTYETKDGGWMAVGALEPHLYKQLVTVLGLPDLPRLTKNSEDCKKIMAEKFKTKTRQEWTEVSSSTVKRVRNIMWNSCSAETPTTESILRRVFKSMDGCDECTLREEV